MRSLFALLFLLPGTLFSFPWEKHYLFEDIPNPPGIDVQVGGMDLTLDGNLIVCLHRGEVMIYDEQHKSWSMFAHGLHEPLGLIVENEGTVLVVQRAELTRLHDQNKDGVADFYETVSDDWGMSGNYHEFAFGPHKDSQGNVYLALGTASNNSAGVREEMRGAWNDAGGLKQEKFLYGGKYGRWRDLRGGVPRMYARVPYRGCILKIPKHSRKAEVYATGLRTPNGIHVDQKNHVWVSDNQGDWVGASKLFRINPGGFHGHPASLLWGEHPPDVIPSKLPPKELDRMRTKSAAFFPQGECGNSPTQMIAAPDDKSFIPASLPDQLLLGEMNHALLHRYIPDEVNGTIQGCIVHFLDTAYTNKGNNRLVFSKDQKSLYLGKTHLSWAGHQGIKKITYREKPYLLAESVKLTEEGFLIQFNDSLQVQTTENVFSVSSFTLLYHEKYGSAKKDLRKEVLSKAEVSGNTLRITLSQKPEAGRIYDIQLKEGIRSSLGELSNKRFWYTAHEVY